MPQPFIIYFKKHGIKIIDRINGEGYQLKTTYGIYFNNIDNGFIDRHPHPQRLIEAWDNKNKNSLKESNVLPIYNNEKIKSVTPDSILALCNHDRYIYNEEMLKPCLIDGGNRLTTYYDFKNVVFKKNKKKIISPCLDIKKDGKICHLYFERTEETIKEELRLGKDSIIYYSKDQQERFLNLEITFKMSSHIHSYEELCAAFIQYQNTKPITQNSSELLKNCTKNPFIKYCSQNFIHKKMLGLTSTFINSNKYYVQISGIFLSLCIGNKTNFIKKSLLDIISSDDKDLERGIRNNDDFYKLTTDDFNNFESKVNDFSQVMKCFDNKQVSMIMFKSLFILVLFYDDINNLIQKISFNKDAILMYDKNNKTVWFNKSRMINDLKVSYNKQDIKLHFKETLEFLKDLNFTKKNIKPILKIVPSRKSTHNTAEYKRERAKVLARDFYENKNIDCLCCNSVRISIDNFECGHIIPRSKGGSDTKENMIAICSKCNGNGDYGMGTQNLFEFQEKFYSNAPSAREYMNKMNYIDDMNNINDINNKIDISNFTTQELKNLAKRYKKSTSGSRQALYNRIRSEL